MDDAYKELQYGGRDQRLYRVGPRAYYSFVLDTDPNRRVVEFDVHAAFAEAARRMFQEIVWVTGTDTIVNFKAKDLDVIVSVGRPVCLCELEGHYPKALIEFYVHTMNVRIAADWDITSPKGELVTSTRPVGEGRAKLDRNGACCRDALTMALDAHFRKAYKDVVMTAWWKDPAWKSKYR
ncbi:MAG: hypothetical protein JW993_10775 [Sedimentisphaerales bacterium]|nr:hypothetical protein [Sedimentisphaerales bacterium]